MVVLLVGIYSEGSVWLVQEVRRVLRLLGVGSKTKNWVDCNITGTQQPSSTILQIVTKLVALFYWYSIT